MLDRTGRREHRQRRWGGRRRGVDGSTPAAGTRHGEHCEDERADDQERKKSCGYGPGHARPAGKGEEKRQDEDRDQDAGQEPRETSSRAS